MSTFTWQDLTGPILRIASDGLEHAASSFEEPAADQLGLTEEQRTALLPSGSMTILKDRTGWAYYALFRAGLLARPRRGVYIITDLGRSVLANHPEKISESVLLQFPDYVEYKKGSTSRQLSDPTSASPDLLEKDDDATPQERMESAFQDLQNRLAQELLEAILAQTPAFFERLVVDLLVAMGYGGSRKDAGEAIGRSGDEGLDGLIREDRLGLDIIYLQAKRWARDNKVSRADVQAFVGSLAGKQAHKGVFITTSGFADSAHEYVRHLTQKVSLIDGLTLANLCIEFGIGVASEVTYNVKRLDNDFFTPA